MAKKVFVTGKAELKVTLSRIADPVDKTKVRSRGPNQVGQLKDNETIRIGKVEEKDMLERVEIATKILTTGKVPAKVKGGHPKAKDATLAKAKGDLTKANKKIAELEKELNVALEVKPTAKPKKDEDK